MLIEASRLLNLPLTDADDQLLGRVDRLLFEPQEAKLIALQIISNLVIKKFSVVDFAQLTELGPTKLKVKTKKELQTQLKDFDALFGQVGPVLGVKAKTESGQNLGQVEDLLIEAETGLISRFYLKNFLRGRIIPRQFLVAISKREIIFKDVVNQPVFDQLASAEAI